MSYHFEALGDERFQMFCQSILTTIYPGVQCLPVGQPDGGRDAVVRSKKHEGARESIIFQVKYVKNPSSKSERDFLLDIFKGEREKINSLVARGATQYFLMTNASGTSHLDVGSIDKVIKELSESLGIEVFCWWRDDLARRVDANSSIKWSFPEILKATDILGELLRMEGDADALRRLDVIRLYMAYQESYDSKLKFKQIELQKEIQDIFVDVPAQFLSPTNSFQKIAQESLREILDQNPDYIERFYDGETWEIDEDIFGALGLMVIPEFSRRFDKVVVEGAPGQGKSTITQYLAQVHRLVLLKRSNALSKVSSAHLPVDARIPFRIDLRDYATWLSGRHPYTVGGDGSIPPGKNLVLESFISAQVESYTGCEFSTRDFFSVVQNSQVLIVLDGFDEVADISIRNRMVIEISDAANRISELAISSQVIVTSRPAAFANSPGFSIADWQHLKILPLSRDVIGEYSEKWLEGRSFDDRERREILELLDEKLDHSHVRDLARNPMQLAILLSLMSVQGASLPDKRTALYDNYIEIFFNRESEKSAVVRDYRLLLIQIHQYLAWLLQSEAEELSGAGNIGESRLREVLKGFLEVEGHSTKLVDELFSGMLERVVALVSRVQGTFEFEVQPLREYFSAKYLHDTAPYFSVFKPQSGTLPERFDALSRNFYWLNVTRFYSGCYSPGELPSLVEGLEVLTQSDKYSILSHPAYLSLTLLKDYVFSQYPRLADKVVRILLSSVGFTAFLATVAWRGRSDSALSIPDGVSKRTLVQACYDIARSASKTDVRFAAIQILAQNCTPLEAYDLWCRYSEDCSDAGRVVQFGRLLDVYLRMDREQIVRAFEKYGNLVIPPIVSYQGLRVVDDGLLGDPAVVIDYIVRECLDNKSSYPSLTRQTSLAFRPALLLTMFLEAANAGYIWSEIENCPDEETFGALLYRYGVYRWDELAEVALSDERGFSEKEQRAIEGLDKFLGEQLGDLKTNFTLWSELFDSIESLLGESWALIVLSERALRLLSTNSDLSGEMGVELFDSSYSLFHRMRYAATLTQGGDWWQRTLRQAENDEYSLAVAVFNAFSWMSLAELFEYSVELSAALEKLGEEYWRKVYMALDYQDGRGFNHDVEVMPEGVSHKMAALLSDMWDTSAEEWIWQQRLRGYRGDCVEVIRCATRMAVNAAVDDFDLWPSVIKDVEYSYEKDVMSGIYNRRGDTDAMPIEIAMTVCKNPTVYPLSLVALAEPVVAADVGRNVDPVGKLASRDSWFDQALC